MNEKFLAELIERSDAMDGAERAEYGRKAKARIQSAYSWQFIGDEYKKVWKR